MHSSLTQSQPSTALTAQSPSMNLVGWILRFCIFIFKAMFSFNDEVGIDWRAEQGIYGQRCCTLYLPMKKKGWTIPLRLTKERFGDGQHSLPFTMCGCICVCFRCWSFTGKDFSASLDKWKWRKWYQRFVLHAYKMKITESTKCTLLSCTPLC